MDWTDGTSGTQSATHSRMDKHVTAMEATDMTEIEERIESQKENAALMRSAMECECPDKSCQVAHES